MKDKIISFIIYVSLVIAGAVIGFFSGMYLITQEAPPDVGNFKDFSEGVQAIFTLGGVTVAVYWFTLRRKKYPRVTTNHTITIRPIDENRNLIRVYLKIINNGEVLLKLKRGEIRIQQLEPIPDEILNATENTVGTLIDTENGATQFSWPIIWNLKPNWESQNLKIEPNESEEIIFDCVIFSVVKAIKVYTFIPNPIKGWDDSLGWKTTTEHTVIKLLQDNEFIPLQQGGNMASNVETKDVKKAESEKQGSNEANKNPMTASKPQPQKDPPKTK